MRAALLILTTFLSTAAWSADAEMAQLPYSQMLDYQQRVAALKDLDQLQVTEQVASTRRGVKPGDITLTIMRDAAHGGPVPIPVDTQGNFTLPVSAALQQEDPVVQTNQPRHTMQLRFNFNIRLPTKTSLQYSQLIRGAEHYNEAMRRQGMMASWFAPKAKGLLLIYAENGHSLTIHSTTGDKLIRSAPYRDMGTAVKGIDMSQLPAQATFILLLLDDDLLKQDPTVTLDALPQVVSPAYG